LLISKPNAQWAFVMTEWFCEAKIKGVKYTFDKEGTEATAEDGMQTTKRWASITPI